MRKQMLSFVVCLVFIVCVFPMTVKAAPVAKLRSEKILQETNGKAVSVHVCEGCHGAEGNEKGEYRDGPYCNHADPWLPTTQHSSMRYIRTSYFWNEIENEYMILDFFQCVFCGFECPFDHTDWYE